MSCRAVVLIRLMVGGVFLSEGLQKFLLPDSLGVGRFARIGIPAPELTAPLVGTVEMVCGFLVLAGLFTRVSAALLMGVMAVALFTTKVPILLGTSFLGLELRSLPQYGLLSMLHEARTDLSMLLGSAFLLLEGAGPWSLDSRWRTER